MFRIYQPSGKIGVRTLPLWAGGIVAAVVVAFGYQLLLEIIPIIYVNVLLSGGLGWVLGAIAAQIVRGGPVRNKLVALVIAASLVTTAVGAKYFFQYRAMLGQVTQAIAKDPNLPAAQRAVAEQLVRQDLTFARHLQLRADQGWNIGRGGRKGLPIKGPVVYLVWLIEFGVVLYFAGKLPYRQARQPFDESHHAWASQQELVMTLPITEPAMVDKIQAAQQVEDLLDLPIPKTDQSEQFALYTVHSLPGAEMEDAYLSVTLVTLSWNAKGEQEKKERPLVHFAILPQTLRRQLVENASLLQEAIEAYREAVAAEAHASASAAAGGSGTPLPDAIADEKNG